MLGVSLGLGQSLQLENKTSVSLRDLSPLHNISYRSPPPSVMITGQAEAHHQQQHVMPAPPTCYNIDRLSSATPRVCPAL
jgi:hypothetical protein